MYLYKFMTRGQFYLTLLQSLLVSDFKVVITCSGYTMNMLFQVIPCSDRLYQVMGARLYHVLTGYALLYLVIPIITWYTKLLRGKLFKKSCGIVFTSCVSSYILILLNKSFNINMFLYDFKTYKSKENSYSSQFQHQMSDLFCGTGYVKFRLWETQVMGDTGYGRYVLPNSIYIFCMFIFDSFK